MSRTGAAASAGTVGARSSRVGSPFRATHSKDLLGREGSHGVGSVCSMILTESRKMSDRNTSRCTTPVAALAGPGPGFDVRLRFAACLFYVLVPPALCGGAPLQPRRRRHRAPKQPVERDAPGARAHAAHRRQPHVPQRAGDVLRGERRALPVQHHLGVTGQLPVHPRKSPQSGLQLPGSWTAQGKYITESGVETKMCIDQSGERMNTVV